MKDSKILPAILSIAITAAVSLLLATFSTHFLNGYGSSLFIATPLVCGIIAVWIYNRRGDRNLGESLLVSLFGALLSLLGFLALGLEGLICMIMASVIVIPMFLLGGLVGFGISKYIKNNKNSGLSILFLTLTIPLLMGFESSIDNGPKVRATSTTVVIDAPIEDVWREVIKFSTIPGPEEFLFRMGIAYPISARIEGEGVGAIRYCNFSTGAFIEPITHWEENRKLAFDVAEQPEPMTEVSPYSGIHPPHLDWAIQSVKGQFLLTQREDGKVELEGTTWFYTVMAPDFYWSAITENIIHRIHLRVLNHIKKTVESDSPPSLSRIEG